MMDVITDTINEDSPWAMLFADDLVLCDDDRERLERRLEIWREKMESVGLKLSREKTEYLPAGGRNTTVKRKNQ